MSRALLVATAALASGTLGCSTFYAEAEQPLVCLTLPTQSFSVPGGGIPAPAGGFHGSYTTTIELGIQDVLPDFLLNGPPSEHVLHFVSLDAAVDGAPGASLDLVDTLEVTARGAPGSSPVELAHYVRGPETGVTRISLDSANPGANLTGLLVNGGLSADVYGEVTIPAGQTIPASFSATVTACFSAQVKKTLEQLINGG